jgi:hypothetical protein
MAIRFAPKTAEEPKPTAAAATKPPAKPESDVEPVKSTKTKAKARGPKSKAATAEADAE